MMRVLIVVMVQFALLFGATINVPADQTTIQAGLNAAVEGDTVLVQPGTYTENIIWPETNGVKLISAGDSSNTIIDGNASGSVISFFFAAGLDSTTLIKGFQLTNGYSTNGGGIYLSGSSPNLDRLYIYNNVADTHGGGIFLSDLSTLKITSINFTSNRISSGGDGGGGIYCSGVSDVTVMDCIFTNNESREFGGGVFCDNSTQISISNTIIMENWVSGSGGGIAWNSSFVIMNQVTVDDNSAGQGGGIFCSNDSGSNLTNIQVINNYGSVAGGGIKIDYSDSLSISNSTFNHNRTNFLHNGGGGNGGGLYISNSDVYLTDISIRGNQAGGDGGGIVSTYGSHIFCDNMEIIDNYSRWKAGGILFYDNNPLSYSSLLENVTIRDNRAREGGGIAIANSSNNQFNLTCSNVIIENNRVSPSSFGGGNGGGVYIQGNAKIQNINIRGNESIKGGGVYHSSSANQDKLFLSNVKVLFNKASSSGGGILCLGSDTIRSSIIADNTAEYYSGGGGGIYIEASNNNLPYIDNCLITRNIATGLISDGGGIYIEENINPTITNCTITNNEANNVGDGIYFMSSSSAVISNNNLLANGYGLFYNDNSQALDISNNWWGAESGPFHAVYNTAGLGDTVNMFTQPLPFLETPNITAPQPPVQNISISEAGNDFITLVWDSSNISDLLGYRLYYDSDTNGYPYTNFINVGSDTSYTLANLPLSTSFYFSVTTYDSAGNESWYSNEVTAVTRVLQANNIDIAGDENFNHIVNHTPPISWQYYDSMGEVQTHYQIQVSTSSDFSSADVWDSGEIASADTSVIYAGSELVDGTTYYLRVKVGSRGFWSDWSALTFRMNTEPTVSVPAYPINDQVSVTPVVLKAINSTDPEADDLTYTFKLYADGTLTTKLDSAIAVTEGADTTTWQVAAVLPDNGQYFWTVSAFDGYESSLISDTVSFLLNSTNDVPTEFVLLTPADSSDVTTLRPSLDWEAAYDPDPLDTVKYTLYLDTPAPGILTYSLDTVTIFQPAIDLQDNTTYHWKVVAEDLAGTTRENIGGYQSFRVNTANDLPGDFALLSPANESMVTNLTPQLIWEVPTDEDDSRSASIVGSVRSTINNRTSSRSITSYSVFLSTDSTFTGTVAETVTQPSFTPTADLNENAVYYWKVEATDNDGGVTASARYSFWTNSVNSPPSAITQLSPADSSEASPLLAFSWSMASDADLNDTIRYTLHYGPDIQNLVDVNTGNEPFYQPAYYDPNMLVDNTTYYWNVTATDMSGATYTTNINNVTVNSANDDPGAFTLVSPDSGSVVSALATTLVWNVAIDDDGDQLSYAVHFGTDAAPPAIDTVAVNYLEVASLTEGNVYYWQVIALDDNGGNTPSQIRSFTVNASNSAPADFALILPAASEELTTLTPTFSWIPSSDVDLNDVVSYTLFIADDTSETSYPGLTDTVFTLTEALAENGTYEWRVVATDLSGATTANNDGPRNFTVNTGNDAPTVPELRAPLNASFQTDLDPAFFWSASVDADPNDIVSYYIKAWSDTTVHNGIVNDSTWFKFNLPGGLNDNAYYEWYVSATDQTEEVLSDTGYFWTDAFPEPPLAFNTVYPADGETGLGSDILFTWNSTVDPDPMDQVAYTLVYATNWDDSLTYNYVTTFGDTSTHVTLGDNAEYYWTVIASDNDSLVTVANDGTPSSLVVGVLSVDEDLLPIEFALHQNYPNPFNPTTQLTYDLPEQAFVNLAVYDLLGRKVTTLVNGMEEPGFRSVTWNATDSNGHEVSAGMYIYVIRAGSFTQTRKMVLLK